MQVLFAVAVVLLVIAALGLFAVLAISTKVVLMLIVVAAILSMVAFSQGRFW